MNRFKRMMGCLSRMAAAVVAAFLFLLVLMWIDWNGGFATVYETGNLSDYRKIVGNYNNDSPAGFFESFFPEKLGDDFSDVRYHYKAIRKDACACEIWLEFTIEDDPRFGAFLSGHTDVAVPFRDGWMEVPVASTLELLQTDDGMNLEHVEMGKILYRESDQRIIFWGLYVFDGGGTGASELDHFFTYFDVDPLELATEVWN